MKILGKISGKWQHCDIVTVDGEIRFQVIGACNERKFELTIDQLLRVSSRVDIDSMTSREFEIWRREIDIYNSDTKSR